MRWHTPAGQHKDRAGSFETHLAAVYVEGATEPRAAALACALLPAGQRIRACTRPPLHFISALGTAAAVHVNQLGPSRGAAATALTRCGGCPHEDGVFLPPDDGDCHDADQRRQQGDAGDELDRRACVRGQLALRGGVRWRRRGRRLGRRRRVGLGGLGARKPARAQDGKRTRETVPRAHHRGVRPALCGARGAHASALPSSSLKASPLTTPRQPQTLPRWNP